jgi:hypothetical protein
MISRSTVRGGWTLAAALPILAVACHDTPTSPLSAPAAGPALASVAKPSKSPRSTTSNEVKYSDKGVKPSSTTYRGVTVSSRAYALRDGSTILDVVAGNFDGPLTDRGRLYKVDLDVFDATGHEIDTKTLIGLVKDAKFEWKNGVASARIILRGLGKNSRFDLKLTASKNDKKYDLALSTVVKFAPDLAVTRIDVPAHVHAVELVHVSATVKELNGDYGGRADCVLYADGTEVDRATGIWVDAASSVSCAFATRFSALGAKLLRVAVEGVTPAEFDPGNNAASLSVNVEPLPVQMAFNASAFQHTGNYVNAYTYQYDDDPLTGFGYHSTYTLTYSEVAQSQYARIFASAPQAVAFPVASVTLSQASDGMAIDSRSYANVPGGTPFGTASDGGTCAQDGDAGFTFILCTYHRGAAAWTTVYYQHYAGMVTYISTQLATWTAPWGSGTGPPGYYRNDSSWGTFVPFGRAVSINVAVVSGLYSLVASPTFSLIDNPYSTRESHCAVEVLPPGQAKRCYDIRGDYLDREGFAVKGE